MKETRWPARVGFGGNNTPGPTLEIDPGVSTGTGERPLTHPADTVGMM